MAITIDQANAAIQTAKDNLANGTVTIDGVTGPIAQEFKDAATKYIGAGAAQLADAIQKGGETLEKLEKVGEDYAAGTALGAGIASVVPIFGTAVGAIIGGWVGGVYGFFDNFGGDVEQAVHDLFNPQDFTPGDYDRQRLRCIKSGGLPHPGFAPDNEDGCVYPSGGMSGGEYPRDPGPGRKVRGDNQYPPPWNGEFPPGLIPDINGNAVNAVTLKGPPPAPFKTLFKINPALGKINIAALVAMSHAPAPAPMPKLPPPSPKVLMKIPKATALIGLIASPDKSTSDSAKAQVSAIVDSARAGDSEALEDARVLTIAQRASLQAQFVAHYIALKNSVPMNTGGMQIVGASPCREGGGCCDECGGTATGAAPTWSGAETARRVGKMAGGLTSNGFGGGEMH